MTSFSKDSPCQYPSENTEDLESELMVSSLLFASLDIQNLESESAEVDDKDTDATYFNGLNHTLEECMETEALRYVGGYIARKLPEYRFFRN